MRQKATLAKLNFDAANLTNRGCLERCPRHLLLVPVANTVTASLIVFGTYDRSPSQKLVSKKKKVYRAAL